MPYEISFFRGNERNTSPFKHQNYDSFDDLASDPLLVTCYPGSKRQDYFTRGKCDSRSDKSLSESRILVIDGDRGKCEGDNAPDPRDVSKALRQMGLNFVITTTHSHSKSKNKFRVLVPTNRPYKKHELKYNLIMLLRKLRKKGIEIGSVKEMFTWSQPWFCPKRDNPEDGMYYCDSNVCGESWSVYESQDHSAVEVDEEPAGHTDGLSRYEVVKKIHEGDNFHGGLTKESWQFLKDAQKAGVETLDAATQPCINMNRIYMEMSKDAGTERWVERYDDIPNQVKRTVEKLKSEITPVDNSKDRTKLIGKVPDFPTGVMETWPDPWPMIFRNYYKVARDPVEELMMATILASCAHCLNNKYVTMEGKFLNLIFLNLASSGVGKDANTTRVLAEISRCFQKRDVKTPIDPFNRFLQFEKALTSDTSFMQCFDDYGNFFWINTEATRIFELMGTKGNASVAGISDKLVEIGDGMGISSKKKANKSDFIPKQDRPNCQVLLCAQPDTISDYLTSSMIDSGLFGRPLVSVSDMNIDLNTYQMFGSRDVREIKLDDEFHEFFTHLFFIPPLNMITQPRPVRISDRQIRKLNEWTHHKIVPYMKKDAMLTTVLRRMGIPVEQIYTLILCIVNEWEIMTEGSARTKEIDCDIIIPLLDFWVDCKVYATEHLVKSHSDPMWVVLSDIMTDILNGRIKMPTIDHKKAVADGMIPISRIANLIANRGRTMKSLNLQGDRRGMTARLKSCIDSSAELGMIVKCKHGRTSCVAFPLDE